MWHSFQVCHLSMVSKCGSEEQEWQCHGAGRIVDCLLDLDWQTFGFYTHAHGNECKICNT